MCGTGTFYPASKSITTWIVDPLSQFSTTCSLKLLHRLLKRIICTIINNILKLPTPASHMVVILREDPGLSHVLERISHVPPISHVPFISHVPLITHLSPTAHLSCTIHQPCTTHYSSLTYSSSLMYKSSLT